MLTGTTGAMCGPMPPTGRAVDVIDGAERTPIDMGLPCAVMQAAARHHPADPVTLRCMGPARVNPVLKPRIFA